MVFGTNTTSDISKLLDIILRAVRRVKIETIGSLGNNVFARRTSTGSGLFWFFDGGFAQIFSQIASITVKKLRNTNFISSRHVKREKTLLPVDVRRSKTPLLKLPNKWYLRQISRTNHAIICLYYYQQKICNFHM